MFHFFKRSKSKRNVPEITENTIRKEITVYGKVQNVGFRFIAQQAAKHYPVTGWVKNNEDGSVTMEIQGTEEDIAGVFERIQKEPQIQINNKVEKYLSVKKGEKTFRVNDYGY